jgi:hypothetical protein
MTQKLDINGNFERTAALARLYVMIRNIPTVDQDDFESKARKAVRDNFIHDNMKMIEDQFILFAIGDKKSVFSQLLK